MSDEQNTVPPPPALPPLPGEQESDTPTSADQETVTLKVPSTSTEEAPAAAETPEKPAEEPETETPAEDTGEVSEPVQDPQEGQEETAEPETPSEPVVENGPNGQTVTMPDGTVVTTRSHPYPVSNSEQLVYERTHEGDQERYPYVPGDREYSPYSDPAVPNSHVAQTVEREIASFGERILLDAEAKVSPMWNALKGVFEGELDQAIASGGGSGKVQA